MSYEKPFAGLKVIDLSQGIAGPYAGMMLAQYGANVIKVEPPGGGDWSRGLGTVFDDQTAYSVAGNLAKRSIVLDLKGEEGRAVLWRLIEGADVFMQGFRPGVMARLGFGYEAVAERERRIIYASVSGFGQNGPLAERPAMDPVLQAYTGLTLENRGEDGKPHRVPVIVIDMSTGIYTYSAIATALFARQNETRGRHIDSSLLQAAASLQVVRMMASHLDHGAIPPLSPPSGISKLRDGWMNITVVRPFEWTGFCAAIGRPDIGVDPRFAEREGRSTNAATLIDLLDPILAAMTVADLSARFTEHRVMHEQLNTYAEFLRQPHLEACGALAWLDHPAIPERVPMPNLIGGAPFKPTDAAPHLGEHTDAILREHGFAAREIADLAARGVVRQR